MIARRRTTIVGALAALRGQFPDYVTELEARFLRQSTLRREMNRYRSLFDEGVFTTAFVPLFAGTVAERGKEVTRLYAGDAFSALLTLLLSLVLLGEIFMPWLMAVIAPGFGAEPGKFDLVVTLTRITLPSTITSIAATARRSPNIAAQSKQGW